MQQRHFRILAAIIIVLIIALLAIALTAPKQKIYAFAVESNGVFIYSDLMPPNQFLKETAKKRTFIVSPQLDSSNSNADAVTDSLLLWLGVLEASDKNAVSLIRLVDEKNNLVYCRTNFGNPKTDVELSASECNFLLSSEHPSVKVLILAPDSSLSNPEAILEDDLIAIKPVNAFDESRISLLLLKAMFEGTQEILDKINELARRISG